MPIQAQFSGQQLRREGSRVSGAPDPTRRLWRARGRRAGKVLDRLARVVEATAHQPRRGAPDVVNTLMEFLDTEDDPQALRDAIAVLAADHRVDWKAAGSAYIPLARLVSPGISNQSASAIAKNLQFVEGLALPRARAVIREAGGYDSVGRFTETELKRNRARLERSEPDLFRGLSNTRHQHVS